MKNSGRLFSCVFLLLIILASPLKIAQAQQTCNIAECNQSDENDRLSCMSANISCLKQKIQDTQVQAVTLKNTVAVLKNQINILQLQINQSLLEISSLEKEIQKLSIQIDGLSQDLDKLTGLLLRRVAELYKRKLVSPFYLFFSFDDLSAKLSNLQYIKSTQQRIATTMSDVENRRQEFDQQKQLKQHKQNQLETKRLQLNAQKQELAIKQQIQQDLLTQTQQSEEEFQKKLDQQTAEFLAIQAICSGSNQEVELRRVTRGDAIANLLQGKSCNSSGTHLHFSVREKKLSPITNRDEYFCKNPFQYLKSGVDYFNCSSQIGGYCGTTSNDPFVPSGSWDWPLNERIDFYQGFGATWAAKNIEWLPYDFHNGIDIGGPSLQVKAVESGTLYYGHYIGEGGCELPYVVVKHDNSNLDSLYLHAQY